MVVVEDDAILATKLNQKLQMLLHECGTQPSFLLLGWNLDSLLQAELEPGLGIISLFGQPTLGRSNATCQLQNRKTHVQTQTLLWTSRLSNNAGDRRISTKLS